MCIRDRAIKAASEAAEMILRIDDMIAARNALTSSGPDESGNCLLYTSIY